MILLSVVMIPRRKDGIYDTTAQPPDFIMLDNHYTALNNIDRQSARSVYLITLIGNPVLPVGQNNMKLDS